MFTCEGCVHTDSQDDGFCYMFSDRPILCLLNKSKRVPTATDDIDAQLRAADNALAEAHVKAGMIAALKEVFSPPSQPATYFNILTLLTKLGVTEEERRSWNHSDKSEKAPEEKRKYVEPWLSVYVIFENGKVCDEIILKEIYGLHVGELDDIEKSIKECVDEGLFDDIEKPEKGGIAFVMENICYQGEQISIPEMGPDFPSYYEMDLAEITEINRSEAETKEGLKGA